MVRSPYLLSAAPHIIVRPLQITKCGYAPAKIKFRLVINPVVRWQEIVIKV